jgi:hypothetical protein
VGDREEFEKMGLVVEVLLGLVVEVLLLLPSKLVRLDGEEFISNYNVQAKTWV